jgi:hypothetical protein
LFIQIVGVNRKTICGDYKFRESICRIKNMGRILTLAEFFPERETLRRTYFGGAEQAGKCWRRPSEAPNLVSIDDAHSFDFVREWYKEANDCFALQRNIRLYGKLWKDSLFASECA